MIISYFDAREIEDDFAENKRAPVVVVLFEGCSLLQRNDFSARVNQRISAITCQTSNAR